MEETFNVALKHACVVLRYFMCTPPHFVPSPLFFADYSETGAGRLQIAREVLESLPRDLISLKEPEDVVAEYQDYRQFFTIWDTLDKIVEIQAEEETEMSRDSRVSWLKGYKVLYPSCTLTRIPR